MVSNALNISLQELLDTQERLLREYNGSPEYQQLRHDLPEDWPI